MTKPRNPILRNPLLRKGHTHQPGRASKREKDRRTTEEGLEEYQQQTEDDTKEIPEKSERALTLARPMEDI